MEKKKIILKKRDGLSPLYVVVDGDKEIDYSVSLSKLREKGFSKKDYPFLK